MAINNRTEPVYDVGNPKTFQEAADASKVLSFSPYWIMVVVPYKYKNTYSPATIATISGLEKSDVSGTQNVTSIESIEESDKIYDLTDYCVNWRVSQSKSSHIMNGSFTLVRPEVVGSDGKRLDETSYNSSVVFQDTESNANVRNIKVQDWVLFWAMDNEQDFKDIRAKISQRIQDPTNSNIVNDWKSGLKFVGKIKSFKSTMTVGANGVVMKKYFVDAQAFSEFDSTIYYNQFIQDKDQLALSFQLGSLLRDFTILGNGTVKTTAQDAVPLFSNLLLGMALTTALSRGTVASDSALSSFLNAQAPNGPLVIPKGVYDLLVGLPKEVTVTTKTAATTAPPPPQKASSPELLFYWPLNVNAVITSPYGPRTAPTEGASTFHKGIDIGVGVGTPVFASAAGKVAFISNNIKGYGKVVCIDHDGGWQTRYGHLSLIKISQGDTVTPETVIALSGNTGISTGPHLHFEMLKNGTQIDPESNSNIDTQTSYSEGGAQKTNPAQPTPQPAVVETVTTEVQTLKIYSYLDILHQYIGIPTTPANADATVLDYYGDDVGEIEQSVGSTPLLYTNTHQYGKPISTPLLAQTIHFDSRSIWTILKTYVNEPINEMFTSIRANNGGYIFPTLICRQLPFTSDEFAAQNNQNPVTKFSDLPEWFIPSEQVLAYDVGYSDSLDVNYVKLELMLALDDRSTSRVVQMYNVPPVVDSADIMRNGLRMFSTVSSAIGAEQKEGLESARFWTKLLADTMFRLKYQLNGNVSCKGIQKPISIGDNVIVNGARFHIEAITHDGSIDMMGRKRFNTSLSLSHGEPSGYLSIKKDPFQPSGLQVTGGAIEL